MSGQLAQLGPPIVHVAVVDDNSLYREWLGQGGSLPAHQHVVARAADAEQLAAALPRLPDRRCDVVVLDLRLTTAPVVDPAGLADAVPAPVQGRDAVRLLLAAARAAVDEGRLAAVPAVLVHTQEQAAHVHVACLAAGASGVVRKSEPVERLGEAIDVVAAGGLVVDEAMAALVDRLARDRRLSLTETEALVLALTAHGQTRQQVARKLGSSVNTVDKHLRSIRDKFGEHVAVDVADAFGLRDLAAPRPGEPPPARQQLRDLARRLRGRP